MLLRIILFILAFRFIGFLLLGGLSLGGGYRQSYRTPYYYYYYYSSEEPAPDTGSGDSQGNEYFPGNSGGITT